MLYTLAALAGFDAVLTLPGIAGFVLSIGIAVDANVLIFERIREELDHGKTVRTAIDEGFRHAMPAIIDSNVSTILTAAVLYQYGTGPVQGLRRHAHRRYRRVARHLDLRRADLLPPVAQPLARRPDAEHLDAAHSSRHQVRLHQVLEDRGHRHHRVHRARHGAAWSYHKARTGHALNYSVEFTGGTVVQLQFAKAPGADVVRAAVDEAGFVGAEVTPFGDANDYMVKVAAEVGRRCRRSTPTASAAQIVARARPAASRRIRRRVVQRRVRRRRASAPSCRRRRSPPS